MRSDVELFMNLIWLTDYINNLIYIGSDSVEEHQELVKLLDWCKYKSVQEIINLNNKHINNAIKEVLQNERFIKTLKEDSNINIETIKQSLK